PFRAAAIAYPAQIAIILLPWHRRSSYEPDAPARGVPQSPRWRVGLVCAKDSKLSCRGNSWKGTTAAISPQHAQGNRRPAWKCAKLDGPRPARTQCRPAVALEMLRTAHHARQALFLHLDWHRRDSRGGGS